MEVDTSVTKILEEADDGQEIILEAEGEYEEEEEEVEEIVEIIEEIEEDDEEAAEGEEIVEVEEAIQEDDASQKTNGACEQEVVYTSAKQISQKQDENQYGYDASADWGDEEYENAQARLAAENTAEVANDQELNTYATYSNGVDSEVIEVDERTQMSYDHSINQENSVDGDNSQHEIIQNAENNLVYTVLGTKKQTKPAQENRSEMEFVEVQRHAEDNLPDDGTIYYVNEEDGTYVQAVAGDGQQYHYVTDEQMEQDNQEWEEPNQEAEQQQEQGDQEQIFLHEDEDGQLYFKNEHGQLQPVYLTPDGNYAIAENSSDEQDSQDNTSQIQEDQADADNYVLPDLDLQPYTSKKRKRDHEGEDDTVTISLIISEDEHGQKRTQVIIPTQPEAKCDLCNKTFKTSLQLLKHNRLKHAREEDITTRNFPCDLCPKRFTDQNSLARHRKTHTEARPYQCLECHESFPTTAILRKHLQTHNPNSLPLPCIYCGRRFQDKQSLMKHEQSHLAGEKKAHICDICQKCFTNPTDLSIHKKNHDPDRKFDCEVCGREFNRLNNLQRHMMVHQQQSSNEEILSCNICGITYKFSSSLTRHMVTTHMNPEKLRQQADEQRRKRESNYRRYLENRKTYETTQPKRIYRRSGGRIMDDQDDDEID